MAMLAGYALRDRHALLFRLVREHRSTHDVADRPDVRHIAAAIVVDRNKATLVERQSDRLRSKTGRVGHAADRNDETVHHKRLCRTGGIGVLDSDFLGLALLLDGDFLDLHSERDFQSLAPEEFCRFPGNLLIDGAEEHRQGFEDRDVGAEATPDRAHLKANDARADDAEALRHFGDRQRAVVRKDALLVERRAGQGARVRTGGDDDMAGDERFLR